MPLNWTTKGTHFVLDETQTGKIRLTKRFGLFFTWLNEKQLDWFRSYFDHLLYILCLHCMDSKQHISFRWRDQNSGFWLCHRIVQLSLYSHVLRLTVEQGWFLQRLKYDIHWRNTRPSSPLCSLPWGTFVPHGSGNWPCEEDAFSFYLLQDVWNPIICERFQCNCVPGKNMLGLFPLQEHLLHFYSSQHVWNSKSRWRRQWNCVIGKGMPRFAARARVWAFTIAETSSLFLWISKFVV